MKYAVVLFFISFFLALVGCHENQNNPVDDSDTFSVVEYDTLMPLSIGNYWLYKSFEQLEPDGSGGTPVLGKFGFIIDDSLIQTINNEELVCYKLFNCGEELVPYYDKPGSFTGSKLIYENNQGLYYAGIEKYDTVKISFNNFIFPYPAVEGESVNGHLFYYSTVGNYLNIPDEVITIYACVSTDSLISTPSGDFNCIVYKMAYIDLPTVSRVEVYYFIKPGLGIVGMIDMVYYYSSDKYRYLRKTLLTDYRIK